MAFAHYIDQGGKQLRLGFTTGTCAALASAGAARLLLTGKAPETVRLVTPKGIPVEVELEDCKIECGTARCAVRKDAGDDMDVTDGMRIYAAVCPSQSPGITIRGGRGIGIVTKPGLDQPVGEAAINRVPRQMILDAVENVRESLCYSGGLQVTIFAPDGEAVAKKTLNQALGVVGGISILGTSGIVEPMSMDALRDTVTLEIRQQAALGAKALILTPGNYGSDFLRQQGWDQRGIPVVKCSNFIGDALEAAFGCGFNSVLLVGHLGKLVKLAGGILNTHSKYGDCRMEILCSHTALCGGETALSRDIMESVTTDGALEHLQRAGLLEPVMRSVGQAMARHMERRSGTMQVGAVYFSNRFGLLGVTNPALLEAYIEGKQI